ncbi:VOC family protein [Stenotrophomonas indicatrix]|uniref:VOC family protein n=1 Tax=Stenotrophomonas indicatrix TaxID=2045451 RepID=UPI0013DA42A1|nr:VOC family protein [Stenotrophomonas indicatrix]MCR8713072.1 VOC family protein [Stenotrophomonas indicatrix]
MAVKRVVANIASAEPAQAAAFYGGVLGMDIVMDHGWIVTYGGQGAALAQLSVASEGGSGAPVPDLSIEVDDLDEVLERLRQADIALEYGPTEEPWGVRRFFVRDPFGRLLNILAHR